MARTWPDDDDLLALVKESSEHQRVWAIVRGLSKHLLAERESHLLQRAGGISTHHDPRTSQHAEPVKQPKFTGERPNDYVERVRALEDKIVGLKKHITNLEECRAFELQTENLLVEGLRNIAEGQYTSANNAARTYLETYERRLGPRMPVA